MRKLPVLGYRLDALLDPGQASNALKAGGDVRAAARADGESFLWMVSGFEPDSVSVACWFHFRPDATGGDPQGRLAVHLVARAHRATAEVPLRHLLARGPLRRFHDLMPVGEVEVDRRQFHAVCHVARRQSLMEPTVSPESNANALPLYYTVQSFVPKVDNDYLSLISMMGWLDEPVLIEMCIEPAGIAPELAAHTRYLPALSEISHSYDHDDEPLFDFRGNDEVRTASRRSVELLRERDPLADEVLRRQQRFHETLLKPHLRFHICVFATTPGVAGLIAARVAECAFEDGSYDLFESQRGDPLFEQAATDDSGPRVVPVPALQRLLGGRKIDLYDRLGGLSNLAPVDELAGLFRFPVASYGSPCCIRKSTDPPYENPVDRIVFGHEQIEGVEPDAGAAGGIPRGISLTALTKHLFVSGVSGSGKTMFLRRLLTQLKARSIPAIVLEPAKTEYRPFKCLKEHPDADIRAFAHDLQIYTPGDETVSPLRINPLEIPPGIRSDEHIEYVGGGFKAAFPTSGPLPEIFAEAMEELFTECRARGNPPTFADLYKAVERVLDNLGYSSEVDSNLRGASKARLGSLTRRSMGRLFQCSRSVPSIDTLMKGHSVIELAAHTPEVGCLVTFLMLILIGEHVRTTAWTGGAPRLVLIFEEAHNLVGRNTDARPSEENADPRAFAAQLVCQMLAEFRSLGVGIVIADQHASAVAPAVVKSTGTKIAFRQPELEDRKMIGEAMLLDALQMEEIARLRPGEAYLFTEGYYGPRRIVTPDLTRILGLPSPPVREALLPFIQGDAWFAEAAEARVTAELGKLEQEMNRFDDLRLAVADDAARLMVERVRVLAREPAEDQARQLAEIARKTRGLRERLRKLAKTFSQEAYRPLLGDATASAVLSDSLKALRTHLAARFETVIEPDTAACQEILSHLIQDCEAFPPSLKGV